MMVSLPPRLNAIADLVHTKKIAADIGTDHGILPLYLIIEMDLMKVIAADVNPDPLLKAEKLIVKHRLANRIECRLGDGLKVLEPGEAETIIIAGMGGNLISELLRASPEVAQKAEQLILQPVQSADKLRKMLLTSGYVITAEKLVKEKHRFYEVILARYKALSTSSFRPIELEIGSYIHKHDRLVATEFVIRKIRLWEQRHSGLIQAETKDEAAIRYSDDMITDMKEVLKWLEK